MRHQHVISECTAQLEDAQRYFLTQALCHRNCITNSRYFLAFFSKCQKLFSFYCFYNLIFLHESSSFFLYFLSVGWSASVSCFSINFAAVVRIGHLWFKTRFVSQELNKSHPSHRPPETPLLTPSALHYNTLIR